MLSDADLLKQGPHPSQPHWDGKEMPTPPIKNPVIFNPMLILLWKQGDPFSPILDPSMRKAKENALGSFVPMLS